MTGFGMGSSDRRVQEPEEIGKPIAMASAMRGLRPPENSLWTS